MIDRPGQRAVVLVMVLGILAAMTAVATAFVMYMNQAYRAAANTQYAAQAELACRSGLEHAIRAIGAAVDTYYVSPKGARDGKGRLFQDPDALYDPNDDPNDPDSPRVGPYAGWYKYFEGTTEIVRYSDTRVVNGHLFQVGSPIVRMEYAVRVYDLDGRLHANLANADWALLGRESVPVEEVEETLRKLARRGAGVGEDEAENLAAESDGLPYSFLGEMARRAELTQATGKYALEQFFTVYPFKVEDTDLGKVSGSTTYDPVEGMSTVEVSPGGLVPHRETGKALVLPGGEAFRISDNDEDTVWVHGNCSGVAQNNDSVTAKVLRPAVNANTAPKKVLIELLDRVPTINNIGNLSDALAEYLAAKRPFRNRHDFEDALRRVAGEDAVENLLDYNTGVPREYLQEDEFNDLLNNFAGIFGDDGGAFDEDDSAYDDPDNPGECSFDGWDPYDDGSGPAQTGGEATSPDADVTWSTELKFTSRFFHIWVLGRGWDPGSNRARGVRRLHAVYDADARRILWLRWNLSSRGSVADMQP